MAKHPLCADPFGEHGSEPGFACCGLHKDSKPRPVVATVVDHRLSKSKGGADDESNFGSLCRRCHNRKTVLVDGGFGRYDREGREVRAAKLAADPVLLRRSRSQRVRYHRRHGWRSEAEALERCGGGEDCQLRGRGCTGPGTRGTGSEAGGDMTQPYRGRVETSEA